MQQLLPKDPLVPGVSFRPAKGQSQAHPFLEAPEFHMPAPAKDSTKVLITKVR